MTTLRRPLRLWWRVPTSSLSDTVGSVVETEETARGKRRDLHNACTHSAALAELQKTLKTRGYVDITRFEKEREKIKKRGRNKKNDKKLEKCMRGL